MVYTCCVPVCKTGYRSNTCAEKISLFKLPKDTALRQQWLRAIPRKYWNPTDSHRVCAKHFHDEDFVVTSNDSRIDRRNARLDQILERSRLKPEAVPRIFDNLPAYLSSNTHERSTNCTSTARMEKENAKVKALNNEFFLLD